MQEINAHFRGFRARLLFSRTSSRSTLRNKLRVLRCVLTFYLSSPVAIPCFSMPLNAAVIVL
jgi:hypothetical protein